MRKNTRRQRSVGTVLGIFMAGALTARSTYAETPLRSPLISVADKGTVLEEHTAVTPQWLAEYVIRRDQQPGLLSYNSEVRATPSSPEQSVEAVMRIGGKRYTVWVVNDDEHSPGHRKDMLVIRIDPTGEYKEGKRITLVDRGLDGRCDIGFAPGNKSELVYVQGSAHRQEAEGLQHQGRFQKLYENALEEILRFYEGTKLL